MINFRTTKREKTRDGDSLFVFLLSYYRRDTHIRERRGGFVARQKAHSRSENTRCGRKGHERARRNTRRRSAANDQDTHTRARDAEAIDMRGSQGWAVGYYSIICTVGT